MAYIPWPEHNEAYLKEDTKEIVIQINGKLRASMQVPVEDAADKQKLEQLALSLDGVKKRVEGKQIRKIITVPNKLVNIVAN